MNPKVLADVPIPEPPVTDIPLVITEHVEAWSPTGKGYDRKASNIVYTALSHGDKLIIMLWHGLNLVRRMCISKDDWVSVDADGHKSSARLDNCDTVPGYTHIIPVRGADDIIKAHISALHWSLSCSGYIYPAWPDGYKMIVCRQRHIAEQRLQDKYDRIKETTARVMMEIRPPVKGFVDWCVHDVMQHYIIYGTDKGICTHCHHEVSAKGLEHGRPAVCPHCHREVKALRSGAVKANNHAKQSAVEYVWYIQSRRQGGAIVRQYRIAASLYKGDKGYQAADTIRLDINDNWHIDACLFEQQRIFVDSYGIRRDSYIYCEGGYNNELAWWSGGGQGSNNLRVYPGCANVLNKVNPKVRYVPFRALIKLGKVNPVYLIEQAMAYPWIEYAYKMGLTRLCKEICEIGEYRRYYAGWRLSDMLNLTGKTMPEVLGVPKQHVKELVKLNPTISEILLFRAVKLYNYSAAMCPQLMHEMGLSEGKIATLIEYQSPDKLYRYLREQALLRGAQEEDFTSHSSHNIVTDTANDYMDYITEVIIAGHNLDDTAILNPHDLAAVHNCKDMQAPIESYIKTGQPYAEAMAAVARSYSWLTLTGDKYVIKPIETFEELINESRHMHHCVGSYAQKYAEGRCIICKLRRVGNEDAAYVTVEYDPTLQQIKQVRGYHNTTVHDDVLEFTDMWVAEIKHKRGAQSA